MTHKVATCVTYDKMMSELPLALARLSTLWILHVFLNHRLDGDLCKNIFDLHFFFSGFQSRFYHIHWFYRYRSFKHGNWLSHKLGHKFLCAFYTQICWKIQPHWRFLIRFNMILDSGLFPGYLYIAGVPACMHVLTLYLLLHRTVML